MAANSDARAARRAAKTAAWVARKAAKREEKLAGVALAATPPLALNLTGPELLGVRAVAEKLAHRMNRPVDLTGTEGNAALLSNSAQCFERLGAPRVSAGELLGWVADWVMSGGPDLGKPTHFESRDGRY